MQAERPPLPPGLYQRLRRLLRGSLELVQLRVELLATDAELGALRFFDAIVLALAALLMLTVGIGLLMAWLLLVVQPEHRLLTLAALGIATVLGGGLALAAARSRLRRAGAAFKASRAELARDLAALSPDRATAKPEQP